MSRYLSTDSGTAPDFETPLLQPPAFLARPFSSTVFATAPAVLLLALAVGRSQAPYEAGALPPSLLTMRQAAAVPGGMRLTDGELAQMAGAGQWPLSHTMVVTAPGASARATLIGRLEPMVTVRGRAPLTGEVSRVQVKVGQAVNVNDPVLELSAGPDSRADRTTSHAERKQSAAESAQVRAANEQAQLQQRMRSAQTQLAAAQERVATAQQRVDEARDIVRRLQRGEEVPRSAANMPVAPEPEKPAPAPVRTPSRPQSQALARANAVEAQRASNAATAAAEAADRQVMALEAKAKLAEKAVPDAQAALAAVQKSFDAGTAKASALDAARAAVEEAESAAKNASAAIAPARQGAQNLRERARTAQAAARKAENDAVAAPKETAPSNVPVVAKNAASSPARPDVAENLSVADAVRLTNDALNESRAAVDEAGRLKARVDAYARQVKETRSELDASSRQLASAQDAVLDETIQQNLSEVRAPASGIVQSVAAVAQDVAEGDVLVSIARPDRILIVWTDLSQGWRKLREGSEVPAFVQTPRGEVAVLAKVDDIEPAGGGARMQAELPNPRIGGVRQWQPGWTVRIGIPLAVTGNAALPNNQVEISVPQEALVRAPDAPAENDLAVAVLVPQGAGRGHRVEWRQVRAKSWVEGVARITGLVPGERLALRPDLLGSSAKTVQIVDNL